jgi:hypothetical protein
MLLVLGLRLRLALGLVQLIRDKKGERRKVHMYS